MSAVVCSHLDMIKFTELPIPIEGCVDEVGFVVG
jgi:hypothetical protein